MQVTMATWMQTAEKCVMAKTPERSRNVPQLPMLQGHAALEGTPPSARTPLEFLDACGDFSPLSSLANSANCEKAASFQESIMNNYRVWVCSLIRS